MPRGRPPSDSPKTRLLTVRMTDDKLKKFSRLCEKEDVTVSEIITGVVDVCLECKTTKHLRRS